MNQQQPISLLICALGGEGGGVLTDWLVQAAQHAGYPAQATSIPGVAQRTGATTYYLEFFPVKQAELGDKRPVLGLYPLPGRLDALISSELLETVRQIGLGHVSAERTLVLTSTARTLTTLEKMVPADGRREVEPLLAQVANNSRTHHAVDMAALTRQAGTVVSAVMLGCLAGAELLPMRRADYEGVLQGSPAAAASLRGFALGWDAVRASVPSDVPAPQTTAEMPALPEAVATHFGPELTPLIAQGYARLVDYQDETYAALYLDRLRRVLQAETEGDPDNAHARAITRETARWLALWMAYDDIVRVAGLKSRAARWQRVRREAGVGDNDLLHLYDHFKPGVPEFAGLLPASLATRLLGWDRRRQQAGKPAWALPLKIGTHTITGMVLLRTLAALKGLRPRSSRHVAEQTLIELWLGGVMHHSARHWGCGHELAQCGRLIKGYGSTNERGKTDLLHLVEQLGNLQHFDSEAARAQALAAAREAALSDASGHALAHSLQAHGLPPRPLREQPVRWMRRRPAPD